MNKEENINEIVNNIVEDVKWRDMLTYSEQDKWKEYLTNVINCIIEKENKQLQDKLDFMTKRCDEKQEMIDKLKDELIKDRMEQFDDYVIYLLNKYLEILGEENE